MPDRNGAREYGRSHHLQVATKASWHNLQPMPGRRDTVPLFFELSEKQANRVRQGYIPSDQDHRWFGYFEDNVLYVHRSWTGICIDEVHFKDQETGLWVWFAYVNRDPEQYGETDLDADHDRIDAMVRSLAMLPAGAIVPDSFDYQDWW